MLTITPRLRRLIALAWAVMIVAVADWPSRPDVVNESDKLVHIASYAILAFLVARAAGDSQRSHARLWLSVFLGCVAFAGLDELHQLFVPYRAADVYDWLADSAGAFLGSLAVYGRRRRDGTSGLEDRGRLQAFD